MPERTPDQPRGRKPAGGDNRRGAGSARSAGTGRSSGTPRAGGAAKSTGGTPRGARTGTPRTGATGGTGSTARSSSTPRPRRDDAPRSAAPRAPRAGDAPRSETSRSPGTRGAAPRSGAPRTDAPRGGTGRPTTGRPTTGRAATPRTGAGRSDAPRAGAPRGTGRPTTGRSTTGRPAGTRPERVERPAGPPLPPEADPRLLPNEIRRELRGIPDPTIERIAGHLVAAGLLVDEDPAAAYEHAKAAKAFAARVGSIREAVGVTAYRAGDFAAALTELKAARRITGLPDHLPLLADCERALGHPEKALAYANDPDRSRLDRASQIELAIVVSGARRDMGQGDAAVVALQGPDLDSDNVESWTPRLWYAYAEALLAAGRLDDAIHWFSAVAAIDEDDETDAPLRVAELIRR